MAVCHCTGCQRRRFGLCRQYLLRKEQVRTEGASQVYVRDGQEGRKVRIHFCPECGTSVYWHADFLPKHIGVAYGAFADPSLPSPTLSAWEQMRHPWVVFGHAIDGFPQAVPRASKG